MKITKTFESEFYKIKHNGYTCYFTLIDGTVRGKTANSVSFPNLQNTKISSEQLTATSAKIIGEMFLKISDLLTPSSKEG